MANASDAKREWIEAALEEGIKINETFGELKKLKILCILEERNLAEKSEII